MKHLVNLFVFPKVSSLYVSYERHQTKVLARSQRDVVNILDCDIVVSDFEIQSRDFVHFQINAFEKNMNSLILPPMG